VHVLDVSSDPDHNRTVVTFAGAPQQVVEGAFQGIQMAATLIDLTQHSGVHPRIGAADVVPFVPLRDITLAECAALARELGRRVGTELDMPVFLYEAAARDRARTNLADIRRGGFEKLQARLDDDPAMQPDYGPARL
jgi:glutamate formiminotransferase